MAGYTDLNQGGIAPIFELYIPRFEHNIFQMYATKLMPVPSLSLDLKVAFTMVILLHYPTVKLSHPDHQLTKTTESAAVSVDISLEKLDEWHTSISERWKADNARVLNVRLYDCAA